MATTTTPAPPDADTDTVTTCKYCGNGSQHPMFVYISSQNAEGQRIFREQCKQWHPVIGISSNPIKRIDELNGIRTVPRGNKQTAAGKGYWQHDLIVGPFERCGTASDFMVRLKTSHRKYQLRVADAVQRAVALNLRVYAREPRVIAPLYAKAEAEARPSPPPPSLSLAIVTD